MQRARSEEAKDTRRQALLDAALNEFFERGFAAARMDDIARRAGLSKGTLYLYFDSKEALFASLIEVFALPNVEQLEAAAATATGAADAIRAMVRLAPVLVRESPVPKIAKILISDALAFPDLVAAYRKTVIERVLSIIAGLLQRAHDAGEISIRDPHLTARLIVAPVMLSAIWRVVFERDAEARLDIDALFAVHEEMLMRGLGVKEGGPS